MINIVKRKKYGRCLVAKNNIKENQIIEVSELIILSSNDTKIIDTTLLGRYIYEFKKGSAIALGLGSLFNHSTDPNVSFQIKGNKIYFKTIKSVKKNEQLFINYGYSVSK